MNHITQRVSNLPSAPFRRALPPDFNPALSL